MAPVLETVAHIAARALERRETCYNTIYGVQCYYSRWDRWGRWVLLGVILFVAILIFFLFSCISSRRRRKVGQKPIMGTGWAAAGQPQYNSAPMQQNYQNPPPQYQQNNAQYGQNADYYGGNQYGNNTQYQPPVGAPPNESYGQYAPPSGPPPAHVK
ncbi:hypothetical protein DOTSEDRAFT_72911 [Dothistroma septosporum NZE10]|uniref:Chitin synthesis regulation, Congo red resistance, RCR protein n=1 Tax=Dothistroma septosporum (strain NZE10 / CBS 128990) TaxID=675120 RepID=N1PH66_DOTSN|nr:hypothetical protein DOTSEDRAFT_72911 [Dothistroma septosporum NZE10]